MLPYKLIFPFGNKNCEALIAESQDSPYTISFTVHDSKLPVKMNGQFDVIYTPEGNYIYHYSDSDVRNFVNAMTQAHQDYLKMQGPNTTLKPINS